jgi:hypothetical protein
MTVELGLTPAHHIIVVEHAGEADDDSAAVLRQWGSVTRAFAVSQAAGLVALAARQLDALVSPTCTYWRDYASRYLPCCENDRTYQGDGCDKENQVLNKRG